MQTAAVQKPAILLAQAASSGFVPPAWSDLAPLLQASALLWTFVFFMSALRFALRRYLQSESFRTALKEARKGNRTLGPLIRLARMIRNTKLTLVRQRFPEPTAAFWFGLPRFISGVVVCVLYIIETYMKGIPSHFYAFQCVYGTTISISYTLSFIYAERPFMFALSLRTLVECLSIPSLLFSSGARWLNFNFLQAYSILVEWALLEKHDIVMRNNSTLARLLINLVLQLFTFLYVTSCGVQFFELLGDPVQALRSETFQITWANSVYFAVVTLMTVGYGDFVPYTLFGRMWIVLHIIFVAYLVSREISLLIDALKSMRRGAGSYVNSSAAEHVIVTGKVKWEFLTQFVKEFLAEPSNLDTKVVVLTSNPTWSDDDWHKFVSHNPFFDHHLMFLEGSALKLDDLIRADVGAAKGVFVLADPHSQDPYREDSDILKAVLTVRKYSGFVPIYALNTLHDSSFQFGIAMEHTDPPPAYFDMRPNVTFPASISFFGRAESPSLVHANVPRRSGALDVQGNRNYGSFLSLAPTTTATGQNLSRLDSSSALDTHGFYSVEETPSTSVRVAADDSMLSARMRRVRRRVLTRKSESLCMQELETVLLAENTFCNGLSTLIANATLRVAPQSHYNDRPWLVEYKLGAECSIQQFVISKEMDNLPFGKVATILQDYGLVLLAVRRKSESKWTLVTPNTLLESEMSTMALSYHDHTVIDGVAEFASVFIAKNKINQIYGSRTDLPQPSEAAGPVHRMETQNSSANIMHQHGDIDSGIRFDSSGRHVTKLIPLADEPGGSLARAVGEWSESSQPERGEPPSPSDPARSQPKIIPKGFFTRSLSTSTASILKKETKRVEEEKDAEKDSMGAAVGDRIVSADRRRSRSSSPDSRPRLNKKNARIVYSNVDKLPAALRGHVIICLDGESPLANLDALLHRIWMRRVGQRKRVPIVVIHPRFPKNFARTLGEDRKGLFLLQGNSLSLETLKQAQYQSARAFLIMASERNDGTGHGSTDSKAIFTVMTLDSLLSDQDTFVCCILDAEDSLQLLRAPRQARRVGVNLGEHREPDLFNYEPSPRAPIPRRTTSSTSFMRSLPPSPFVRSHSRFTPIGASVGLLAPFAGGRYASAKNKGARLRLKGMTRSSSMRLDQAGESSEEDDQHGNVEALKEQQSGQQKSREELYERQRYASGELVISSLFTALLVRDFTDPGYIRLIRQLIGSSSGSSGSWIRQVDIPESWTRAEKAIGGRTYRETAIRLLELGCIALGLYRSGDAPVREETSSEQCETRGEEQAPPQLEEVHLPRTSTTDPRSVGNRISGTDTHSSRRHARTGTRLQEGISFLETNIASNRTSVSDRLFALGDQEDEFDQMYYTCTTTKRRIYFREAVNGENVLPYVYTCPEPYSLVVASDAVFVLCDPAISIPPDWDEE